MTSKELQKRLELAREKPEIAHLLLANPTERVTCKLCGGTLAPIIDGKHLNPDKNCV